MSAADLFNSFRAFKREQTGDAATPLTQPEVDSINALLKSLGWSQGMPTKLERPDLFFAHVRAAHGKPTEEQVSGFNALLGAMGAARWPLAWTAYGLATPWVETNKTMQPVQEAYWLTEAVRNAYCHKMYDIRGQRPDKARELGNTTPGDGAKYRGRGYPQLTGKTNYVWADEELGLDGALIANPDMALQPTIAAQIMVRGMEQGAFTRKRLADYLPISGQAGHEAFKGARRIINGQDRAAEIAKLAIGFQAALEAGGWG